MIKIDFDDTYEPIVLGKDLSFMTFYSPDKDGSDILLKIKVSPLGEPLLPNVFNLAFGPVLENEDIDEQARITHVNLNKLFSTILFFSLNFLQANPDFSIGINGSDDVRAYLYHRMFQTNRQSLNDIFETAGVDWYVKLLRNDSIETDEEGYPLFKPRLELFDYNRRSGDLYRYYVFYLKQKANS